MYKNMHPEETLLQGVPGRTQQHTDSDVPTNDEGMHIEHEKWNSNITTKSGTEPSRNANAK